MANETEIKSAAPAASLTPAAAAPVAAALAPKPAMPAPATANPMQASAARAPSPVPPSAQTQDPDMPPALVAPDTAEDPSRPAIRPAAPVAFSGYPKTKYHPVYGAKSAKDPNDAHSAFVPERNWFDTPEEADAHRTDREAQQVIHNNTRVKVDAALNPDEIDTSSPHIRGEAGVVRNSVAATESMKNGFAEPL